MNLFLVTLTIGGIGGFIFLKFKIPGALIIGSILFVSAFNIITDAAFVIKEGRLIAQVIAGAFIGAGISKSELFHMKYLTKPSLVVISGLLALSIITGLAMYYLSPMDLITSLMSSVPGGISYLPLISDELGADSSKVAIMQFVRLIFGIGVLPYLIKYFSKMKKEHVHSNKLQAVDTIIKGTHSLKDGFLTFGIALLFGYIGSVSGVPSGTLTFSLFSIIAFKLITDKAYVPKTLKQFAQILAGSYIGSGINMNDVIELKYLILPTIILISGYFFGSLFLGKILQKMKLFTLEEGMFAATPAGAADMALLLEDFGIFNKDVIVVQLIRMIVVISLFPQVMILINNFFDVL